MLQRDFTPSSSKRSQTFDSVAMFLSSCAVNTAGFLVVIATPDGPLHCGSACPSSIKLVFFVKSSTWTRY